MARRGISLAFYFCGAGILSLLLADIGQFPFPALLVGHWLEAASLCFFLAAVCHPGGAWRQAAVALTMVALGLSPFPRWCGLMSWSGSPETSSHFIYVQVCAIAWFAAMAYSIVAFSLMQARHSPKKGFRRIFLRVPYYLLGGPPLFLVVFILVFFLFPTGQGRVQDFKTSNMVWFLLTDAGLYPLWKVLVHISLGAQVLGMSPSIHFLWKRWSNPGCRRGQERPGEESPPCPAPPLQEKNPPAP